MTGSATPTFIVKADVDDKAPGYLVDKIDGTTITLNSNDKLVANGGLAPTYTVKANIDDVFPGYLSDKIDGNTITLNSSDKLVASGGSVPTYTVKANLDDAVPGFLSDKIDNITITINSSNKLNSSGIAAVVDDPTPQLGGDLDCSMRRILNTSVYENMTGDLYFADYEQTPDSIYYNPCVSGGITMSVGSFSVGNYVRASFQTPHSMKLNTQITINLHYILPDETNIGKNHTWGLDVMTAGINGEYTIVPGSPFRASKQIAANDSHTHCILSLATFSTENLTVNTKIEARLQRIASAGFECESGVCVISVDSIYQADTLGSRTPTEK